MAFLTIIALGFVAHTLTAQRSDRQGDRRRGERGRRDPDRRMGSFGKALMRALDADGNGELSAAEVRNATAALMRLDQDGDGKVTGEELRRRVGRRREGRAGPETARRSGRTDRSRRGTPRQRPTPARAAAPSSIPGFMVIPGGEFDMGDHHDLGGREHGNDEVPVHRVRVDSFHMAITEVTNRHYCDFLNAALSKGQVEVRQGGVYRAGTRDLYCDTSRSDAAAGIRWEGQRFSVRANRGAHPMVCVRWIGAAAYCNWLSTARGTPTCYDLTTGACDFSRAGFRLPTEAEWEYAARGGHYGPYLVYPWGNEEDRSKANWPNSGDPFEAGPYPWTTPVGFYSGKRHAKADFHWPGRQESYQTTDGANGFGLHDMSGNVWEWVNDWYGRDYYRVAQASNPQGPDRGTPMRDGRPYRALRGGNWYNGRDGHGRVSNRNPSYYRGPDDPDHRWYHIGFRVVLARTPESTLPAKKTVGLLLNDPRSFQGYTLFPPKHGTATYLVDNQGQVVHSWTRSRHEPGQSVYLLPDGHLLRTCAMRTRGRIGGGEGGRIEEYDWNDNLVWEFDLASERLQLHHDIEPLPNGNILALAVELKTREEAIAAGFDPDALRDDRLYPDCVIEIQKTGRSGGKIVWQWHVWDHLIQDSDPRKPNYGDPAKHPGRIHVGAGVHRRIPAFWNHMNSIDYNAKLDQIVLSVRGSSEIWVIDHGTTTKVARGRTGGRRGKGGDLLYRWGNPEAHGAGSRSDQQLYQQHDAQWIETGCPGAGNILIFNNGLGRGNARDPERRGRRRGGRERGGYSTVDEIVPPVDRKGRYTRKSGSAFGPAGSVWSYQAENPRDFFASQISGAHRLPNGNTLICDGTHGLFFEVTRQGEVVWKYVNPVTRSGILAQGELPSLDHRGHQLNAVFKIHRYAPDYPGLTGRDLTSRGPLERPAAERGRVRQNSEDDRRRDRRWGRQREPRNRRAKMRQEPRKGREEDPHQRRREDRRDRETSRGGERAGNITRGKRTQRNRQTAGSFHTDVPAHTVDIILVRPTDRSVTASVLAYEDLQGCVAYGTQRSRLNRNSRLTWFKKNEPVKLRLTSLKPDTRYYYQLWYRESGSSGLKRHEVCSFHTKRPPGSPFTFTIQADSHLDRNTSPELYAMTLRNARSDKPDFHIDLGDTFMTDKYRNDYREREKQYHAQRYFLGLLCHSAPLFFVLGNHDGEAGWRLNGTADNLAVWSCLNRKKYFPNPFPDTFYSGNPAREEYIGLLEDYYAWHWGDGLFIVLDPFWYTTSKSKRGDGPWGRTLGEAQYRWLEKTLQSSRARFKFVFIHHLVGGSGQNARGGTEVARNYEWGGHDKDGRYAFQERRPGWAMPIHRLLVKHGVSIVFHGHDHFYAKQDLDGIVYQLVPQPGHPGGRKKTPAGDYGYLNGKILPGSGHLRVKVSGSSVTVDFVRSAPVGPGSRGRGNGEVAHSYTIRSQ